MGADMTVRVPLADLAPGTAATGRLGRDEHGRPVEVLVVLAADGAPRVYRNLCRHLPVPLDGGSRSFFDPSGTLLLCGTHGAFYRLEDGLCIEGPCEGEALVAMPFTVVDGVVVVRSDVDTR